MILIMLEFQGGNEKGHHMCMLRANIMEGSVCDWANVPRAFAHAVHGAHLNMVCEAHLVDFVGNYLCITTC